MFMLLVGISGNALASAELVPPAGTFCDCFQLVNQNSTVCNLMTGCIDWFDPARADLNGESYIDIRMGEIPPIQAHFAGNGMLDCSVELKLVEAVLKNPVVSLPNGLTYQKVKDAWDQNEQQLAVDIGTYWPLIGQLINGLPQILKGYLIIGDGSGDGSDPNHITWTGSAGLIQAVMHALGGQVANPNIDLNQYVRLPQYFSQNGDADGDGCTNAEEFAAYGHDPDLYAANALDPNMHPDNCRGSALTFTRVPRGGWFEEGQGLTLLVGVAGGVGEIAYQWVRDGRELQGETTDSFTVAALSSVDTGWYSCRVTDQSKGLYETSPALVTVYAAGSLPGTDNLGLLVIAAACLLLGAFRIARAGLTRI
jgi:hypothetical protein